MGRIFCFAGGYGDAVGYELLKSIFCASITGNVIKAVAITAEKKYVTCIVVVSIFYGVGSLLSKILATYMKSLGGHFTNSIIGILLMLHEIIYLVMTIIVGTILWPNIKHTDDMNDVNVIITGVILSLGMGAQVTLASLLKRPKETSPYY